jgi:uncharacterized protein
MKSKTSKNKKTSKKGLPRRYSLIFLLALMFYIALILTSSAFLIKRSNVQAGQLQNGQNSSNAFSRSLDLRVAAKNDYPSDPLLDVQDLGTTDGITKKIISFNVKVDNLTEYGLMELPAKTPPPGGYPAIILCHGYESPDRYQTTQTYIEDMDFYAQHGFVVIKPDYRGQGLSSKQGQAESAYYSMAYNTDIMSLITALKRTSYIDKSNLSLWGHSMGAYVALRASVLSPDIKNLFLLAGPVGSLNKMYLTYIPPSDVNNLNALKTRSEIFAKYGTPADNTNFWKYASPINMVKKIKAHVQIHVGSQDTIVPPVFSSDLDKALTNNHIDHEYYEYAEGQHGLDVERQLIWSRSLHALQPNNTPPSTV